MADLEKLRYLTRGVPTIPQTVEGFLQACEACHGLEDLLERTTTWKAACGLGFLQLLMSQIQAHFHYRTRFNRAVNAALIEWTHRIR